MSVARLAALCAFPALLLLGAPAAAQPTRADPADELSDRLDAVRGSVRVRRGGVLGLMGYNMTPDGSTNALQVDRSTSGGEEGDPTLTLGQLGFGFTLSESFPLFLEIYFGYARYDPRAVFTNLGERRLPIRWNNVALTTGLGYDIRLGEYLWLRPILNLGAGYAAGDVTLFGEFLGWRTGRDIPALTDRHVNVGAIGGSLTLAYYDYRPARDIDMELRYTQLHLETIGDTMPAARGGSTAQTLGFWTRYRWPTGWEAFGRPVRWVLDGSASWYLGDQRDAISFDWSVKVGGGIEFDIGRHEIGAAGINLSRIRLIGRYFVGDNNVTGASFGIGMSF